MTVEHVSFAPQKQRPQEKNKGLFIIKVMGSFCSFFFFPPLYTSEGEKEMGRRMQQLQTCIVLAYGWLPGPSAMLSPLLLSRVGRKYHKTALR